MRVIRTPVGEKREHESLASYQARSHTQAQSEPQKLYHSSPRHENPQYSPAVLASFTLTKKSKTHTHIIPPKHGHAFLLKPGTSFRIIDLHGTQVVDLMAWTHPITPSGQHSAMSYTRYNLSGSAPPQVGECIYTNLGEKMLKLTADTVKTHDMLYMACNPSFYANMGLKGHRNCAENISGAVTESGLGKLGWNDVVDPFNVFQNTPYYSLKALGCSKAGDYCEWENVLDKDVVVGLSCCPFEEEGFNGGKVTEVAVVTEVS